MARHEAWISHGRDVGSEHAGLGFTQVGTLDGVGYKHGRWLGTVLMQRRLGQDRPPTRA